MNFKDFLNNKIAHFYKKVQFYVYNLSFLSSQKGFWVMGGNCIIVRRNIFTYFSAMHKGPAALCMLRNTYPSAHINTRPTCKLHIQIQTDLVSPFDAGGFCCIYDNQAACRGQPSHS